MAEDKSNTNLTLPNWIKPEFLQDFAPEIQQTLAATFASLKSMSQHPADSSESQDNFCTAADSNQSKLEEKDELLQRDSPSWECKAKALEKELLLVQAEKFQVMNDLDIIKETKDSIVEPSLKQMDAFSRKNDCLNLLLIGKTGNGKSATGNTILKRKSFKSEASSESVTSDVKYEVAERRKRKIKVVDGPGIGDTHYIDDIEKATEIVMNKMKDAVLLNPDGYHAFLLVIKYGNRLTKEDKECIRILKAVFGPDFIKNYCILIVTNGDSFKLDKKESKQTFKQWCEEQKGIFKDLYAECDERAVLFNNITTDKTIRKKQMTKLLECIDTLQHGSRCYTNKHFEFATRNRQQLMAEIKEPLVRQNAIETMSIIFQKLDDISQKDPNTQIEHLNSLQIEAEDLFNYVNTVDNETNVLQDTICSVNGLCKRIQDKIEHVEILCREREEASRKEEETKKEYLDQLNKLEENYKKKLMEDELRKEELLKIEENIREKERNLEVDFQMRQQQLKLEIEEERQKACKEIEEREKQLEEAMSNQLEDESTLLKIQEERYRLDSEMAIMFQKIEEKEKTLSDEIEKERLAATQLIQDEQIKHDEKVNGMEKEIQEVKEAHEKEKDHMAMVFAILLSQITHKMKMLFLQHATLNGIEIAEMKEKYDNLKKEYDAFLTEMGRTSTPTSDERCKAQ